MLEPRGVRGLLDVHVLLREPPWSPEAAFKAVTVPLCWLVIVIPSLDSHPPSTFLKQMCYFFSSDSLHRLTLSLIFCLFSLPLSLSGSPSPSHRLTLGYRCRITAAA